MLLSENTNPHIATDYPSLSSITEVEAIAKGFPKATDSPSHMKEGLLRKSAKTLRKCCPIVCNSLVSVWTIPSSENKQTNKTIALLLCFYSKGGYKKNHKQFTI